MWNYNKSSEINCSPNWSYVPYHPSTILVIGGSWSGKCDVLLKLRKHEGADVVLRFSESKHRLLINGREKVRINELKNIKVFIGY